MNEEDNKRNREMVDSIYEEVVQCVNGELYRDENGECVGRPDEADDEWDDTHEQMSLYDYFDDIPDLKFTVTGTKSRAEVVGVSIMVTFGGPNIYVHEDRVRLHWWSDYAESRRFPDNVEEAILEFASEMFNC